MKKHFEKGYETPSYLKSQIRKDLKTSCVKEWHQRKAFQKTIILASSQIACFSSVTFRIQENEIFRKSKEEPLILWKTRPDETELKGSIFLLLASSQAKNQCCQGKKKPLQCLEILETSLRASSRKLICVLTQVWVTMFLQEVTYKFCLLPSSGLRAADPALAFSEVLQSLFPLKEGCCTDYRLPLALPQYCLHVLTASGSRTGTDHTNLLLFSAESLWYLEECKNTM